MHPRSLSLGVGLTSACNLQCSHCYRVSSPDALDVGALLDVVSAVPVRAVNFGTGENGLHPRFVEAVGALLDRGVPVTMTTNGLSAKTLPDALLARLRDVELSIDWPDEVAHDRARGAGNWALVAEQMARCAELGVRTTVTSVMMASNHLSLGALAQLAASRGALLRINVYQPVRDVRESLSYAQFWEGWRRLFEVADLVTCGEPILRAVLGLPRAEGAGCGAETVRITPRGEVVPCVYERAPSLRVADLVEQKTAIVDAAPFRAMRRLPVVCETCEHRETCGGGCASRRSLARGLESPDMFCPFVRGEAASLRARLVEGLGELPKAASACTTIVRWRG